MITIRISFTPNFYSNDVRIKTLPAGTLIYDHDKMQINILPHSLSSTIARPSINNVISLRTKNIFAQVLLRLFSLEYIQLAAGSLKRNPHNLYPLYLRLAFFDANTRTINHRRKNRIHNFLKASKSYFTSNIFFFVFTQDTHSVSALKTNR